MLIMKKILYLISLIENSICTVGIWLTTFLIFLSVINRYWVRLPIMWLNDFALYCFIFFMLFATALTAREKGHIAVDIFRRKMFKENSVAYLVYGIFLNTISITILSIFIPITYKFMLSSIKYPEYSALVRWFNTSWLRYFLFFVMCLILIHLLTFVIKDIIKLKK
jgi:TRAP-type C4-dicarboxylate transport system permease small subunit